MSEGELGAGPGGRGRKVRVCHVVCTNWGVTWMVEELRELRRQYGYDVAAVVSAEEGPLIDHLRAEGIACYAADFDFAGLPDLGPLLSKTLALARLFRRERFDVVQTHLWQSMVIGRLAAWLADVPVRLTTAAGPYHLEAPIPRWFERATCWMDSALIGVCTAIIDLYRGLGVSRDRLALVYYGVDERVFDPATTPPAPLREQRPRFSPKGLGSDWPRVGAAW